MPNRLLPTDELPAAFQEQARSWREQWAAFHPSRHGCHHCWHTHVGGWAGQFPVPRHCCWCGISEGQQHGPYAEGR